MAAGSPLEAEGLERYEVLHPLATGGMAELFLARPVDPAARDRLVVIKRLQRQLTGDPEYTRMFLDEARIASTLHHPNVVEVYEIGDERDEHYIAMEHLHGHDLRSALARTASRGTAAHGALRIEQALSIARFVAAGLAYTHERAGEDGEQMGIVHRDVSPHNVFLTYDGAVKVVDFGIAKASTQLSRTRTGVLKGKVAYMSPEQAMGRRVDRRSDLFCVGILLWEMTTGRWLFRRKTELDTLNAVVHSRPPRPSRAVPRYPRDLERLVMKTLSWQPDHRWASAGELIEAIDELARRRRLALGTEPIAALMASVFSDELAAWQEARSAGRTLGEHLVALGPPVERSDDDDAEYMLPAPALGRSWIDRLRDPRIWIGVGAAAVTAAATAWIMRGPIQAPTAQPTGAESASTISPVPPAPIATPAPSHGSDAASAPTPPPLAPTLPAPAADREAAPAKLPTRPPSHRAPSPTRPSAVARPAAPPVAAQKPNPPSVEELDKLP